MTIKKAKILFRIVAVLLLVSAYTFLSGSFINKQIMTTPQKRVAIKMDANFLKARSAIGKLPDGKLINFPIGDAFYQIIPGANDGIYIGSSIISFLDGRHDYAGYQTLSPFSEQLLLLARQNDYKGIGKVLSLLNVKYILLNSNRMYDNMVPDFYGYTRLSFPPTISGYKEIIGQIAHKKLFSYGDYSLYQTDRSLPLIYIPDELIKNTATISAIAKVRIELQEGLDKVAYVDSSDCALANTRKACRLIGARNNGIKKIQYKEINPIMYSVDTSNNKSPFVLVFLQNFHSNWKLYEVNHRANSVFTSISDYFGIVEGNKISEYDHFIVNGYANGWYIDTNQSGTDRLRLIIVQENQRTLVVAYAVTFISIILLIAIGLYIWTKSFLVIFNWFRAYF